MAEQKYLKNKWKYSFEITFTNFIFIQAFVFTTRCHCFVFTTRTPESISNPTGVFLWIWWFFSWSVFFHRFFWNTGFLHVWLQFCKVRQVFIIWNFTFFNPIIFIFRSTVYKFRLLTFLWWNLFYLQNLFWAFWVYLIFYIRTLWTDCFFERNNVSDQKEINNFLF